MLTTNSPDFYTYKVTQVVRVVDGDTYDLQISVGFHLKAELRFRLLDVDTPEIYGRYATEDGQRTKTFVENWFAEKSGIYVQTIKTDSFGRWLAYIYADDGESLGDAIIAAGHGKVYIGAKKHSIWQRIKTFGRI